MPAQKKASTRKKTASRSKKVQPEIEEIEEIEDNLDDDSFDEAAYYEEPEESEEEKFKRKAQEADERENFNIFDFCEQLSKEHGMYVYYEIKRNHDMYLGSHHHPFSWEEVKKRYGGGRISVIAKNADTKQFVKKQTQHLPGDPKDPNEKVEEKQSPVINMPQPQQPQVDVSKIVGDVIGAVTALQTSKESSREREEREEKRETQQNQGMFFQMMSSSQENMIKMMQTMQENNQKMFMDGQKQTNEMIKAMNDNTSKMVDKMQERFEKSVEESNKRHEELRRELVKSKKDDNDPFEMVFKVKNLMDTFKEEVSSDESSETSGMSKVLTSMIPLISSVASRSQLEPQTMMPHHQIPAHQIPPQQQQRVPQQRVPQQRVPTSHSSMPKRPMSPQTHPGLKMKPASPLRPQTRPAKPVQKTVNEKKQKTDFDIEKAMANASPVQQQIVNVVGINLANMINEDPDFAAVKIKNMLQEQKISNDIVVKEFPFELLWGIAKALGENESKKPWFERFYANFTATSSHDDGKDTESEEYLNSVG